MNPTQFSRLGPARWERERGNTFLPPQVLNYLVFVPPFVCEAASYVYHHPTIYVQTLRAAKKRWFTSFFFFRSLKKPLLGKVDGRSQGRIPRWAKQPPRGNEKRRSGNGASDVGSYRPYTIGTYRHTYIVCLRGFKIDFFLFPNRSDFGQGVEMAGKWAKYRGKPTVRENYGRFCSHNSSTFFALLPRWWFRRNLVRTPKHNTERAVTFVPSTTCDTNGICLGDLHILLYLKSILILNLFIK